MLPHHFAIATCLALAAPLHAASLPIVANVERQPLAAQARRVAEALDMLGSPLPEADRKALEAAIADKDAAKSVEAIQAVLDKYCIAGIRGIVRNKADTRLTVTAGPASPDLAEQGWRVFLVKIENPEGVDKVELRAESPNAAPLSWRSSTKPEPTVLPLEEVNKRFLELAMFNTQPLLRDLSGLELEYRVLQIYSRDAGRKEAALGFSLWREGDKAQSPRQRVAESNEVRLVTDSAPAVLLQVAVKDADGTPAMGSFIFRDSAGRVYPGQSRRVIPDFSFQPQVYRADGEALSLQPGKYTVTYTRGPEYRVLTRQITVPAAKTHRETFELQRWVHPAKQGWYSGDHHIHAAGCKHYESPREGVTPRDVMRHLLGEGLNVGCCLNWGGEDECWYHQKSYFGGPVHKISTPDNLLRYDVEVAGFPSGHCGHLCLLRLREVDYPGTRHLSEWPSWNLPILKWARSQGAVVGFAHTGWGLAPEKPDDPTATQLPNYLLPLMNGIGANEYLVDIAHEACDFIATVDTPSVWELNIWYHTLNCGYRCRIAGETDFPCIYGEKVGLGRSYVRLAGKLNFDDWVDGIKKGRCYVGDGLSHLMDFSVNDVALGDKNSEVALKGPGTVKIKARVAALLEPKPTPETERIRKAPQPTTGNMSSQTLTSKPYWHVERARVGETRQVPVELVVNGKAVAQKLIEADGSVQDLMFEAPIQQSSWMCLRIYPSSHTNPVFVLVDGQPIRASKRSADWCLKSIDKCWEQKRSKIRETERADAAAAYDKARAAYKKILAECSQE